MDIYLSTSSLTNMIEYDMLLYVATPFFLLSAGSRLFHSIYITASWEKDSASIYHML